MRNSTQSRLEQLEAVSLDTKPYLIVGSDEEACKLALRAAEAAGKLKRRSPVLVITGVPRSEECDAQQS